MKLKQRPDDFFVEELTDVAPGRHGPFAFYRLEKRGWTTPDAIAAIRRRWDLHADRVAYGGLKDRHAHTIQYLSIHHGPQRGLHHHEVELFYLGQLSHPYGSRDIRANRFYLTLRDLSAEPADRAGAQLDAVRRDGVPNYFDDQRFGSVGDRPEFVAKHMVSGDFEAALKLALAGPYEFDPAEAKREKATLLEYWGRWPECKERLPRGHARSLVDYLVHHPTHFRGAVERLRPDLQGMYLSAYQSYLWNAILADVLTTTLPADDLVSIDLRLRPLPMSRRLSDESRGRLHTLAIPLPAARSPFDPAAPWADAATRVLAAEGLEWSQLKIKGVRKPFFTKGERAAFVVPSGLTGEVTDDELNVGRSKLTLAFDLPRGCYATMVVKRVLA
ncbi:MAG: tRNA pseudouridine(13) synthase TruD [Gemmataceae bacterium]